MHILNFSISIYNTIISLYKVQFPFLVPIKIHSYLKIISFKTYITLLCQREIERERNGLAFNDSLDSRIITDW